MIIIETIQELQAMLQANISKAVAFAEKNDLKEIVNSLEKQIYKNDSWKEELYKILKDKYDSDFLIDDEEKGRLCVIYDNLKIRDDIALEKAVCRTIAINIPRDRLCDILVIYDYLGQLNRS